MTKQIDNMKPKDKSFIMFFPCDIELIFGWETIDDFFLQIQLPGTHYYSLTENPIIYRVSNYVGNVALNGLPIKTNHSLIKAITEVDVDSEILKKDYHLAIATDNNNTTEVYLYRSPNYIELKTIDDVTTIEVKSEMLNVQPIIYDKSLEQNYREYTNLVSSLI